MLLTSIRFITKENSENVDAFDESLIVYSTQTENLYRVVMRLSEDRSNVAFLTREAFGRYLHTLLRSLTFDVDPYKNLQVSPALGPSVLYTIPDLQDTLIRHTIEDIVHDALLMRAEPVETN